MRHNEFCNVLCSKHWSPEDATNVADFIDAEYLVHLYVGIPRNFRHGTSRGNATQPDSHSASIASTFAGS
jgi:hypothetical protein